MSLLTSSMVGCWKAMKAANPLVMCVTNRKPRNSNGAARALRCLLLTFHSTRTDWLDAGCLAAGVTPQRVADVLLAAGASPAMIDNPDEVGQFAGLADMLSGGLYLNTGLHSSQMNAMSSVADWRKTKLSNPPQL